jgi:uncharacterized protein YqgQ
MKLLLCFFALTFTYSSFAYVYNYNQIREEIKQLATEDHNPHHGYSKARKILMQEIHLRQDSTGYFVQDVYCKIKFRKSVGPGKMPSHTKINIEHTWPRSRFGVSKRSSKFKLMEADLHHLYPSDSVTNSSLKEIQAVLKTAQYLKLGIFLAPALKVLSHLLTIREMLLVHYFTWP